MTTIYRTAPAHQNRVQQGNNSARPYRVRLRPRTLRERLKRLLGRSDDRNHFSASLPVIAPAEVADAIGGKLNVIRIR